MSSPVGDQLLLGLGEGFLREASSLPWGGRSPRALTKGYERFILKTQGAKGCPPFRDPAQFELWPAGQKGPQVLYLGAPLLVEPRR